PLVVIARFTGTPADGHGQHQLSGYLTPQAYRAAADPNAFPEQFKEGLRPWKALKLYVSQSMQANSANPPSLLVNTGDRDPLLGRSYFEIAMEGRSQHKTQEMGTLELRGKQQSGVRLLDAVNKVENEKSVFDGIDTTIRGIAAASGNNDEGLKARLAELQTVAESAVSQYDAFNPQKLIPVLAKGVKLAREAAEATTNADTKQMLDEKRMDFQYALQMAAGVVVDALSDSETVNPGTSVGVAVRVFAPEVSGIKVLGSEVRVGQGWKSESTSAPAEDRSQGFRPRNEVSVAASYFKVTPPENALPTQPYWLVSPRKNFTFDWSAAGNAKNRPFQDEEATAAVRMNVGGEEIVVTKTVQYRYADDIRGEIRRSLNVVPRVTNALDSGLIVVPRSVAATTKEIVVSVTNHAAGASAGTVSLDLPDGWKSTAPVAFDLKVNGQKTAATFTVTIPAGSKEGSYAIGVKSTVEGKSYNQSVQEIAYDHIQTHRRYSVSKVDVKVL
ncbi:MAG: NEW3 domain-containing protein, partial [Acidobacteriota bacterium]